MANTVIKVLQLYATKADGIITADSMHKNIYKTVLNVWHIPPLPVLTRSLDPHYFYSSVLISSPVPNPLEDTIPEAAGEALYKFAEEFTWPLLLFWW